MHPRPKKLQLLRWLPNRWVTTRGDDARAVYLTFDDGPHPEHTPALLDVLAEHAARATFFVIGREAQRHPGLLARIVAEGHALGNHSWSHPQFDRLSLEAQLEEIARTDRLLAAFDGRAEHDFRPPRGVLPRPMLRACIRQGRPIAYWSYDTLDYGRPPVASLIESARRHPPRGGDILLMHDDYGLAADLLRALLPEWSARGLHFPILRCPAREAA
jgi:peptidoglycan-N-acetylglucosamine deacetylase